MSGETRQPLVTICIPAYNAAATIAETLGSVLAQTYRNIRVVVSDNASTDGTPDIVRSFAEKDPRVALDRLGATVSGEKNFTRCIGLGGGDYTAIYHSDDVYTPGIVSESVAVLESHPAAAAVFTMAEGIDSAGSAVREYKLPAGISAGRDGLYTFETLFKAVLKYGNFFFCPSVMARTSVYQGKIGAWNEAEFRTSADLDVWFRMMQAGPVAIIDKPLLRYRLAANSYSYKAARSRTARPDIFLVLDRYIAGAVPGQLSRRDRLNYRLQVLRDNANRAFNLLLKGERAQGLRLLLPLFDPVLVIYALPQPYHLKVLLYGWAVLLLHLLPLTAGMKDRLFRLRFGN